MHNQLYSKQETYSRYLISLLRDYKYEQFLNALKGENIYDAIYLAQELAKDEESFKSYYFSLDFDGKITTQNILAEIAAYSKEARKGYAALVFAHWKYRKKYCCNKNFVKNMIAHEKVQHIIDELSEYLSELVKEYFSSNSSLAEILSKLTKEAVKYQSNFDYNTFFEKHPQLFEILLQLTEEQRKEFFHFILGFIMRILSHNIEKDDEDSIALYQKENDFISDFITFSLKTQRSEVLQLFLKCWRFSLLGYYYYYNKIMYLAFTKVLTRIMQDENLLQRYVELDSDIRKFFVQVLNDAGFSIELEKLAIKLLRKGYYEAFYDIFVISDKTNIMKKIVLRKTYKKVFLKFSSEEQKKIIDAFIEEIASRAKRKDITIYNALVVSMLAEGQEELFWYLLSSKHEQINKTYVFRRLGKYLATNLQALDVFEKMNEEKQEKLIDFLAKINTELYEYSLKHDIDITYGSGYYSYYHLAFALLERGNVNLFVKMIKEQSWPLKYDKRYYALFKEDLFSVTEKLLEKQDITTLNEIIEFSKGYVEDTIVEQLRQKITVALTKATNNSIFDL